MVLIMLTTEEALATLKDARHCHVSWPAIVSALIALERASPVDGQGRPWITVASAVSGYTANQIRLAQRTYATLEKLLARGEANGAEIMGDHSFSNLEVIARISGIDPVAATGFLKASDCTYAELVKAYRAIKAKSPERVSARGIGQLSAAVFLKQCGSALAKHNLFFDPLGRMRVLEWPKGFAYATPSFVGVSTTGSGVEYEAFSCCNIPCKNKHVLSLYLVRIATESTFFCKLTILAPPWTPISEISDGCDVLGLDNVDIVELSHNGETVTSRRKTNSPPRHDRRHVLASDSTLVRRLAARTE
jgi:hypothetical protein